ncbi:MAG TPA: LysR substrate-binding domain-containing protein [Methylomirabilota bacterium]|nr:LysR substrate-binding domain-containing protein [Methylomirabilota bacterium]
MELRHLRYFVAVAEELHFGRAAQRLCIAQPPLSQQIRRLEHELGVSLFQRGHRRVDLTDVGRAFLVEARLTLAQADHATQVASRAARGEAGHLIVGHMASAELNVFPRLLPVFRTRYPAVDLEFQLLGASEQLQMLRDGRIHAGFLRLPANDRTLTVMRVVREPLVAVLPQRHPLARRRSLTLRALGGERLVLFQRRHAPEYYDSLVAICRQAGVEPAIVQETTRLYTTLSLVATGRGVSLMPKCVARLGSPGVVCRPLRAPVPYTEMGLAYDPSKPSRLLRAFVTVVDELFGPLVETKARRRRDPVTLAGSDQ